MTDTWRYSAFGEELTHTGTGANPYRFAGERYVGEVGLYQNRARWLDTGRGAFVGADKHRGNLRKPRSLSSYQYSVGEPTGASDPTGLFAESLGQVNLLTMSVPSLGVGNLGLAAGAGNTSNCNSQILGLIAGANGLDIPYLRLWGFRYLTGGRSEFFSFRRRGPFSNQPASYECVQAGSGQPGEGVNAEVLFGSNPPKIKIYGAFFRRSLRQQQAILVHELVHVALLDDPDQFTPATLTITSPTLGPIDMSNSLTEIAANVAEGIVGGDTQTVPFAETAAELSPF